MINILQLSMIREEEPQNFVHNDPTTLGKSRSYVNICSSGATEEWGGAEIEN